MAEKLTKSAVKKFKQNTKNNLLKYVCDYVLNRWDDYGSDKNLIFTEVLTHGCQSGIVGDLIYYSDTVAFYEKYKNEINALLYEVFEDYGFYDPCKIFGEKWDADDPLALDTYNQNLLAWFGFEEALRQLALNFDDLQNYV